MQLSSERFVFMLVPLSFLGGTFMNNHSGNNSNRYDREHGGRDMKLQDVFLNHCRRERVAVTVHLVDGSNKKGLIIGFDTLSIILEEDGRQHLLYKTAIIAVNPLNQFNYIFNEASRTEYYGRYHELALETVLQ